MFGGELCWLERNCVCLEVNCVGCRGIVGVLGASCRWLGRNCGWFEGNCEDRAPKRMTPMLTHQ